MNRANTILIVIVFVIGAFVWIFERPGTEKPEGYVERKPLVAEFDATKVKEIELSRKDETLSLFLGEDKLWHIGAKDGYHANERQAAQVIASVQKWKVDARIGTAKKAKDYMVDKESGTRVVLKTEKGKVLADLYTGRVGGFNAKEAQRNGGKVDTESFGIYVRRQDSDDVYFMKGLYLGTFSPDTASFMDKKIFELDPEKVTQVTASCGGKELVFTRKGEAWNLGGLVYPPDDEGIKQAVNSLCRLYASSLGGKYEAGKFGIEEPACTVSITLKDGTVHRLTLGKESDSKGFFARKDDAPYIVVIPKNVVETLRKDPAAFAGKRLFGQRPELTYLAVSSKKGKLILRKKDNKWMIDTRELGLVEADFNAAWKVESAITTTEIKTYVGRKASSRYGLKAPRIRITAEEKDGKTISLSIGNDAGDGTVYARTSDSDWVVTIPAKVIDDLTKLPADLKKAPAAT